MLNIYSILVNCLNLSFYFIIEISLIDDGYNIPIQKYFYIIIKI